MDDGNEEIEIEESEQIEPIEEDREPIVEDNEVDDAGSEDDETEEYEDDETEEEQISEAEAVEAYKANYSYKVLDEEFEMDDRIKGAIKDEDGESYFRRLLEQAEGVPKLVGDRQSLRSDNTRLMETESQRQAAVGQLNNFVKNNDLKPFLDTFGVNKNQILQYASNLLKLEEMEPNQRAEYERNEQSRLQGYDLQHQNQVLQTQNNHLQTQQLGQSVDHTLGSPEFSNYVREYDTKKGQGAFKREIAQLGNAYWHSTQGQVVAPERLAREFIQRSWMGPPPEAAQQHQEQRQSAPARQRVVVRDRNKPTMPNVRGSGASPVKSYPKSIADLRNLAQEKSVGG